MSQSTELVRTEERLPSPVEINERLAVLADESNTAALGEVALQAAAYQEYEKRQNAMGSANRYGRIKVLAEAHIGRIDADLHPQPKNNPPLLLGERELGHATRTQWRLLGTALRLKRLEGMIEALELHSDDGVTSTSVYRECVEQHLSWVDCEQFRRELARRSARGLKPSTGAELARASGLAETTIYKMLKGTRIASSSGLRIAETLELDIASLRFARRRPRKSQRRKTPRARKLPGGRLDQAYVLIRKALQELDRAAGQGEWGTSEAFDHLYKAEDVVGRAMKRAVTTPPGSPS